VDKENSMRNPERIDKVINQIRDIWKCVPDLRLGQLILNVISDTDLYYIEDDVLLKLIKDLYTNEKI
jgi:hypothetical protein